MVKRKDNYTILPIFGVTLVLSLFMGVSCCVASSSTSLDVGDVETSSGQSDMMLYENALPVSGPVWYPKLLVNNEGYGVLVWVQYKGLAAFDGLFNVTINYRTTSAPLSSYQAWRSWGSISTLVNVYQRPYMSFMDAALDANGNLNVFFSNESLVVENSTTTSVWNASSGAISNIKTTVNTWTSGMNNSAEMAISLASRGASGVILFDGDDRHLLWNDGANVYYKLNAVADTPLASAVYVGECDMALKSNGDLVIVYSKGGTVATKEIYMRIRTSAGTMGDESQKTNANKECIDPNIIIDPADDSVLLVWSSQENTVTHRYVVKLLDGATTYSISTDYGGLATVSLSNCAAIRPQGVFYEGKLNLFYLDSTDFTNFGGGDIMGTNVLWQQYLNTTYDQNKLSVISSTASTDDLAFSVVVDGSTDDMYVVDHSGKYIGLSQPQINLAKLDIKNPVITVTSAMSLDLPSTYTLTFTISEDDIESISVNWNGVPVSNVGSTVRTLNFTADQLKLGAVNFAITVIDEVGNENVKSDTVTFRGVDPLFIITIVIIAAAAAGVVLFAIYMSKTKLKREKQRLQLQLGGKKTKEDTWGDDSEADDGSERDDKDLDLKKDLKKVDM